MREVKLLSSQARARKFYLLIHILYLYGAVLFDHFIEEKNMNDATENERKKNDMLTFQNYNLWRTILKLPRELHIEAGRQLNDRTRSRHAVYYYSFIYITYV